MASIDDVMRAVDRIENSQLRTEQKLDETKKAMSQHMEASGIRDAEMRGQINEVAGRVGRHEDGHKENRGWFGALWITALAGIILWGWEKTFGRKP